MKKSNNKGFSLVELIVVVAIMAVLVGILAPAYLSYVEKSRAQKDASAVEEVRHAIEVALAEENVYDEVKNGDSVVVNDGSAMTFNVTNAGSNKYLENAVTAVTGTTVDFQSKAYENKTVTISIEFVTATNTFKVTAGQPS